MEAPFIVIRTATGDKLRCTRCHGQVGSEPTTDPWVLRRLTCLLCGQSYDQPNQRGIEYLHDVDRVQEDARIEMRGRPRKTATGVS